MKSIIKLTFLLLIPGSTIAQQKVSDTAILKKDTTHNLKEVTVTSKYYKKDKLDRSSSQA